MVSSRCCWRRRAQVHDYHTRIFLHAAGGGDIGVVVIVEIKEQGRLLLARRLCHRANDPTLSQNVAATAALVWALHSGSLFTVL